MLKIISGKIKSILKYIFRKDIFNKIPPDDILSRQRYKLFCIFTGAGMFIALAIALQTYFLLHHAGIPFFTLLSIFIIYGVNYFSLQYHERKPFAYAVTILSTFLVIHVLTYYSGGIRNSGMFYLGSVILCAFMLLGSKAGKSFFVLSSLHLVYFFFISENTGWVSNILVGDDAAMINQDFLITGIMALFFMSAQMNYLESGKNIVIQKITQSRNILAEKNRELRKLSIVASKANNGIIITNSVGIAEWVNDGFTRLTGYTFEEIVGRNPGDVLYGALTDNGTVVQMNHRMENKMDFAGELLEYHKDGNTFWIQVTVTPITDEENETSKFIFITSDITERKKAEAKLAEYLHNLEKTNKELDKFAYVVSHDLKAPLRAIGNLAGWIEEDKENILTEDGREQFKIIKGRVSRMEDLINGLLEYSRAHRKKEDSQKVSMATLIKETFDFIGAPSNCTMECPDHLPTLFTEKIKMQQIFSNLMGNAIKFNDKEQIRLLIRCEEKEKEWQFSIEDNGPGIEPKYHEKIFVIFQTLNPRDTVESTGVGLAIVKKIIEEEGGRVWVESDKGKGAKFFFTWPKTDQDFIEPSLTTTNYFG